MFVKLALGEGPSGDCENRGTAVYCVSCSIFRANTTVQSVATTRNSTRKTPRFGILHSAKFSIHIFRCDIFSATRPANIASINRTTLVCSTSQPLGSWKRCRETSRCTQSLRPWRQSLHEVGGHVGAIAPERYISPYRLTKERRTQCNVWHGPSARGQ